MRWISARYELGRGAVRPAITISRWSSDAERDRLLAVLHDKGQNALLDELQKLPAVGYINMPGSLRYELRFAWQRPEAEGGRMVVLMTDRYIGAWEAANRPRTIDYPFTLIQLQLDKDGKGVGKASIATKITQTKDGTIELENFSSSPVMLNRRDVCELCLQLVRPRISVRSMSWPRSCVPAEDDDVHVALCWLPRTPGASA